MSKPHKHCPFYSFLTQHPALSIPDGFPENFIERQVGAADDTRKDSEMDTMTFRKRKRYTSPSDIIDCFYKTSAIPQALDNLSEILDGVPICEKIELLLSKELLSRLSIW